MEHFLPPNPTLRVRSEPTLPQAYNSFPELDHYGYPLASANISQGPQDPWTLPFVTAGVGSKEVEYIFETDPGKATLRRTTSAPESTSTPTDKAVSPHEDHVCVTEQRRLRRKDQNRNAQRAYRDREKQRLQSALARLRDAEQQLQAAVLVQRRYRELYHRLCAENEQLWAGTLGQSAILSPTTSRHGSIDDAKWQVAGELQIDDKLCVNDIGPHFVGVR